MQLLCRRFVLTSALIFLSAGLASAHNGIVRIINQNQTAFIYPPESGQRDSTTQVSISAEATWDIWNQWNATHKEGTDDWSFRNAGNNAYTSAVPNGRIVTIAGSEEVLWTLTALPDGGHLIQSTVNGLTWTNLPQYNERDAALVLREADGSSGQRFNFLTLSGRLE